ncbi:electron transfer flavoprotein subunit alpha [Pseudothermotoga hypogea DSM 11164 = NBRC 106472]|uniref:Electron transfer flavoprotein subunit alpha n=1 Tax=Pseudothermotoga hypogea DSM 11164 = NBRC 106472 TaxID=1123384 RepID=A0A0X1KQY5_9THEM|nr:electron transfer flavoprotein subunit alpha/FixB family protein [Pseudothermotoga hypogea]AJC73682.1 electron transfer flavoprotein subunit alpha [Pseudothermotoga hypogea DSM 11164 = NBRC 106472]
MILVLNNKIDRSSFELLSKARKLADKASMKLAFLLMSNSKKDVQQLARFGPDMIVLAVHEKFNRFSLDPFLSTAKKIFAKYSPSIVLAPATTFGRTLMPALAASFRTGLTADCTELDVDEKGNLLQTRPAIGGNVMATIVTPTHRPQMATVRPGVFEIVEHRKDDVQFIEERIEDLSDRCQLISVEPKQAGARLEDAKIIVSVGKGLRKKENVEVAFKLASLVKGAVGASRAVVDARWLSHDHQVGLSGKTVKPRIYIAAGISGAVQHLAGMQTSEIIVAINKDRYAPIFKVADIGIVADAYWVLSELVQRLGRENDESGG